MQVPGLGQNPGKLVSHAKEKTMKSFTFCTLPALALLLATCFTPVAAQTVYRCGNSYSQTPCEGATTLRAEDPRSDAQRAQAKQALARDQALIKNIEAQRNSEEREQLQVAKRLAREQNAAAVQARAEAKKQAQDAARIAKQEAKNREGGRAKGKTDSHKGELTVSVQTGKKKAKSP